jgi:hypothetical protein
MNRQTLRQPYPHHNRAPSIDWTSNTVFVKRQPRVSAWKRILRALGGVHS